MRGDPEGFARQQVMLDDASQLVALAQAKVAELEANTPSLKEVCNFVCFDRGDGDQMTPQSLSMKSQTTFFSSLHSVVMEGVPCRSQAFPIFVMSA